MQSAVGSVAAARKLRAGLWCRRAACSSADLRSRRHNMCPTSPAENLTALVAAFGRFHITLRRAALQHHMINREVGWIANIPQRRSGCRNSEGFRMPARRADPPVLKGRPASENLRGRNPRGLGGRSVVDRDLMGPRLGWGRAGRLSRRRTDDRRGEFFAAAALDGMILA